MRCPRLALFVPLVLTAGCRHPTEGDLAAPMRLWNSEQGLCGEQIAVDGEGVLWRERGCENGVPRFTRVRRLTDDEVRRVDDAFARLPAGGARTDLCPGTAQVFTRRTASVTTKWVICKEGAPPHAELPAPYDEAARALDNR